MTIDITIPLLLIILGFGMALYYLLLCVTDTTVKKDRERKRILRGKLKTPPCSRCMRGFLFLDTWHCNCNEYKEQVERLTTERPEYVAASDVRGTKWCRYEPGLEDGEGI